MRTAKVNEARGRSRDKTNSESVVINLEERNEGTYRKSPKQSLASAEELTIMLSEGKDSSN